MVLTSFNCIASLLINNRPNLPGYDLLFDVAIKLSVFESIFRWNFIFRGDDLEEYKAKELQFYDSLITSEGNYYLKFSEFTIPLVATLHLCSVRSCLFVEKVLVRTLNTVSAALCSQSEKLKSFTIANDRNDEQGTAECNYNQISASSRFMFRRLCMGLFDPRSFSADTELSSENECFSDPMSNKAARTGTESSDLIMCPVNSKPFKNCTFGQTQAVGAPGASLLFRPRIIDSLFDLLVPYVYRESDLGWQARDSLLLLAASSSGDEEFSRNVVQHSTLCQVLATGLATFYANLPHRLATGNQASQWPSVMIALEECELQSWQFAHFFDALQFCRSVLEVSHPLVQTSLLYYIHSGFFESVIGQSLVQSGVEEVITATIYLERLLSLSIGSPLLPTLLRFLLSPLPTEYDMTARPRGNPVHTNGTSAVNKNSDTGGEYPKATTNSVHSHSYMDLLISRLHCCNTLLGIATLSLFNTILGLNCEDMMVYLVLRYLVPFRDKLLSIGWKWPDAATFRKASEYFTKLTQINGLVNMTPDSATVQSTQPASASPMEVASTSPNANTSVGTGWRTTNGLKDSLVSREIRRSVAELDVDDDSTGLNNATSANPLSDSPVTLAPSARNHAKTNKTTKDTTSYHPMETMMPVPSSTNGSVVMTGIPAPYCPEFNDSHIRHECHPHNSLADNGQRKQNQSPEPSTDDWLAYTTWARAAVESRQMACANWHLLFDQYQPMANQLASHDILANLNWCKPVEQYVGNDNEPIIGDHSTDNADKRFTNGDDLGYMDTEFSDENLHSDDSVNENMVDVGNTFEKNIELNSEEFMFSKSEQNADSSGTNIASDNHNYMNDESKPIWFPSSLTRSLTVDSPPVSYRHQPVTRKRRSNRCRRSRSNFESANDLEPKVEADVGYSPRCFRDANQVKSWYCLSYLDSDFGDVNMEAVEDGITGTLSPQHVRRFHNQKLSSSSRTQPTHHKLRRSVSLSDSAVENVIRNSHLNELDMFVSSLCNIDCPVDVNDKDVSATVDLDQYFDVFINESVSPRQSKNTSAPPENHATQISLKSGSQWSDVDLYQSSPLAKGTDDSGAGFSNVEPVNSLPNELQHLWLINSFLSGGDYSPTVGEDVAAIHSAEIFLEGLARRSFGEASDSQKCSPIPTAQIDCTVDTVVFPDLGPFLTTLLLRMESMPQNCFYANLYLTNLLSHLVAYPVPLLRAILLLVPSTQCSAAQSASTDITAEPTTSSEQTGGFHQFTAKCLKEASGQLLQTVLYSVRQTLDSYAAQLSKRPDLGLPSFADLILDARRYFRNSAELESRGGSDQSHNILNQARAHSLTQEQRTPDETVKNNGQRLSLLRRIFRRIWPQQSAASKKETTSSSSSQDEKVHVSSFQIHHMLHNQPTIHESWSQFKWLPEVSETDILNKLTKRRSFSRVMKKEQRKNSQTKTTTSGSRRDSTNLTPATVEASVNWPTTQRMVLCAVVLEEFSKELSALSMEHSVRC